MHGEPPVAYGQIYVESEDGEDLETWECMAGQQNGLCGAAQPGAMFLITGLHTGRVAFTVELHDVEPPIGEEWEEIVEASFRPHGPAFLTCWGGAASWSLDLPDADLRVRYNATGMAEAGEADVVREGEPCIDRYLLQLWPAPPAPDRVVRQTSGQAAYWHDHARQQPAPPTPEQKAEALRLAAEAAREAEERSAVEWETIRWGGRLPSDRVRGLQGNARAAALRDVDLAETLAGATSEDQIRVARWIARRALTEAGLAGIPWIVEALTAVEADGDLPALFKDIRALWDRMLSDPAVPRTLVKTIDGLANNFLQQAAALPTVIALGNEDPLLAALEAFWAAAAAFGHGRTAELGDEVRGAFPAMFEAS
jgi:hypothetical protein